MSEYLDWRREDFHFHIDIPTRWGDNDMLGHLNNVSYNRCIETVVVYFTMKRLGIDWKTDEVYPLVVESLCRFHWPLSFPGMITASLRAAKTGRSSIHYEIALFGEGEEKPAATGHFIHVFVSGETQKSVEIPPT